MIDNYTNVKSFINMEQVVSLFSIEHKKNRYICPFHQDTNPSASIKNEKFHCFSCGWHGDIFDFAKDMGLTPVELASAFDIEWHNTNQQIDKDFYKKIKLKKEKQKQKETNHRVLNRIIKELIILRRDLFYFFKKNEQEGAFVFMDFLVEEYIKKQKKDYIIKKSELEEVKLIISDFKSKYLKGKYKWTKSKN